MIAILLGALFAVAALASVAAIADAAVRGRNAFRLLSGELARIDSRRQISVTIEGFRLAARTPAMRAHSLSVGRLPARRPVRALVPLCAAA